MQALVNCTLWIFLRFIFYSLSLILALTFIILHLVIKWFPDHLSFRDRSFQILFQATNRTSPTYKIFSTLTYHATWSTSSVPRSSVSPHFSRTSSLSIFHHKICVQVPLSCNVITPYEMFNLPFPCRFFLKWPSFLSFLGSSFEIYLWKSVFQKNLKFFVPGKEHLPCAPKILLALATLLKFFF